MTLVVAVPAPTVPSPAPATSAPVPGVPSPAQSAAEGAVFPVQGTHSFGGPENRFGAPRNGYYHEGQDVLTAEGTPDVAPYAGDDHAGDQPAEGAGYYAVEHTPSGFDFMFAHCMANSFPVKAGQSVTAGQQICQAGQTGDATGPHLHFEMWVGGWQRRGGHSRSTRCLIWKLGKRREIAAGAARAAAASHAEPAVPPRGSTALASTAAAR